MCHKHLLVINNDGEAQAIVQPGCTVARGDQHVPQDLSDALREAIQHEQENYWVGLPCSTCATGKWYHQIKDLVRPDYEYLTKAVVTTNRNWKLFTKELQAIFSNQEYRIHWVSGEDQATDKLPFKIATHIPVANKNSWKEYESMKNWGPDFQQGTVTFFSCGPLGRVLARQWFEQNPKASFIDIGSAFDPYTRNVWHACHNGTLRKCAGCN